MLQLVAPELTLQELKNDALRVNVMKKLLVQIHPSNFADNQDAQAIYEDVQTFYDLCCSSMNGENQPGKTERKWLQRRNQKSPNTVVELVVQFNVRQKWHWLAGYARPLSPTTKVDSGKVLAPLVAYQCINSRGAIAHGKRPSLIYSWENVKASTGKSVMDVLDNHGGYKCISGGQVDEIKVEIIQNGPVISFSFIPTSSFAREHANNIVMSRVKKHHYSLIIGWKLTEFGTVWLIQSYNGEAILEVPVGQCSIDETILVPKDNFSNLTWQTGPYYDKDMSSFHGWLHFEKITLILKSHDLECLAETFGDKAFDQVIKDQTRFVIRDKKIRAHSRSCVVEGLCWEKDIKAWKVTCSFNDKGSSPLLFDVSGYK